MRLHRPEVDWNGLLDHPPAWLGRRGAVLVVFGIVWVCIGLSVTSADAGLPANSGVWHVMLPVPVRVAAWVLTGLIAIVGATVDRPRWEMWGFVALIIMPAERFLSYAWSWVLYVVTRASHEDFVLFAVNCLGALVLTAAVAWRFHSQRWLRASLLGTAAILALVCARIAVPDTLQMGYDRGLIAALTWSAVLVAVYTIAGWPEPPRPLRVAVAEARAPGER